MTKNATQAVKYMAFCLDLVNQKLIELIKAGNVQVYTMFGFGTKKCFFFQSKSGLNQIN